MNSLVSPHKLFQEDLNCFKIATNNQIGIELRDFFSDNNNNYIWAVRTRRQTLTPALRFTESIDLKLLVVPPTTADRLGTLDFNQVMETKDTDFASIPVFKKTIDWVEQALLDTGAGKVEIGRFFFSKLKAKSNVDLHTDSGKYFSYYDRFHFTVTAANENVFIMRDQECILDNDSLYWVNNHVPHWLANNSNEDRINIIVDARLS
jgi:hypothetical protein